MNQSLATTFPDDASIERHARRFLDRTLPKREWTHEGHFAAALWLLKNRPELTPHDTMRMLITRYNEATGTPNTDNEGYHHTITLASMRAAAHHLAAQSPNDPLHETLHSLMGSAYGRTTWPLEYWQAQTLFGPIARRSWVDPDLKPLPF
jgi:hypothetical protein